MKLISLVCSENPTSPTHTANKEIAFGTDHTYQLEMTRPVLQMMRKEEEIERSLQIITVLRTIQSFRFPPSRNVFS